jgi:hypothetical protein
MNAPLDDPSMEVVTMNTTSNRLPELQALVLAAHHDVQHHTTAAAAKALSAGEILVEAKGLCRHGEWGTWLKATGIPERSAQRYMLLHRAGFKSATVSYLGFDLAEHYASASLKMIASHGRAGKAVAGRDGQITAVTHWWREPDDLVGLFHVDLAAGVSMWPRRPFYLWSLALVYETITADLDVEQLPDVPFQEVQDLWRQLNIPANGSRLPFETAMLTAESCGMHTEGDR